MTFSDGQLINFCLPPQRKSVPKFGINIALIIRHKDIGKYRNIITCKKEQQVKGILAMVRHAYRILLVDDDTASLDVLAEVLNRDGYEIFPAVNGYEAFKIIQEDSIDLSILDYELPDTTGLELLQQIKPMQPGMPVIIMSGNPSPNIRFDVFEAGAYTFIPKPIDLSQFRQYVAHALDFKQQWTSTSQTSSHTIQIRKSILFRWIRRTK